MQIAFLGMGAMGVPMARNLLKAGYNVVVWNRTLERAQPLSAEGARLAATARAAAAGADVIITMLSDPDAVRAVATGPDGLLAGARRGAVWVEASTIGPSAARELAAQAATAGVRFLDAPVLGSVPQATDRSLVFLVGGDRAVFEETQPILNAMGKEAHYMGITGQGAAAKVVNNMVVGAYLELVGEGLGLAERLGLDREQVLEMLLNGPASAPILQRKIEAVRRGEFQPAHFQLKLMRKDLGLALEEGGRSGLALPVGSAAHAVFQAAEAGGLADADFAAVVHFAARAGKK